MNGTNGFVDRNDVTNAFKKRFGESREEFGAKALYFTLSCLLALLFAFPYYWLVRVGFVWPSGAILGERPSLIIEDLSFYNFVTIYYEIALLRYFLNSVLVSLIVIGSQLIICSLAAYAFTMEFYGRKFIMGVTVAAMLIPFHTIFLTDYLVTVRLGLVNSYAGIAIVHAVSIVNLLILYSAFNSIPDSMIEAARLDGASEAFILFGVIWPNAKPALTAVVILAFVNSWNEYLWVLLVATDDSYKTLPVVLAEFQSQLTGEFTLQYAFAIIVLVPIVILFVLLQKHFIQSVTMSAMKQ
ncbi:carbohydrate ABC transporter permease [Natrononativus amylolyticus]|uniref:carbohydrate ABC transporter permease n=1 Tax=Natrononativus amylolyticus TaxID=2963434 RepID=UPI0020CE211E|nr:carbohydrate ABC transporter permease [Natrononativus amylolyticus]